MWRYGSFTYRVYSRGRLCSYATTEEQQIEMVQVYEDNCVGVNAGIKSLDQRRVGDLREQVGSGENLFKELTRTSKSSRPGHM